MPKVVVLPEDDLWALAVWREARGEPADAKLGVAWVIKNRTEDPKGRWPKTVREVILEPKQFSSFNPDDPNYLKFPEKTDPSWADCKIAVAGVKTAPDPTAGATNYHSLPVGVPWPRWARGDLQTAQLGAFHFYRL